MNRLNNPIEPAKSTIDAKHNYKKDATKMSRRRKVEKIYRQDNYQ
jgi:hypothetical protein